MATFNNGESGSSVRAKINAVLQHADGTSGEIVFNDAGADVDFRIESDTDPNAFFLDGATGNLGLGVTPSAWGSGSKNLEITANGTIASAGGALGLTANAFYNGTTYIYKTTAVAANYVVNPFGGGHQWFTAPSGTAGNPITFTQAMTLDASGNLGIGTTSYSDKLTIAAGSTDRVGFSVSGVVASMFLGNQNAGTGASSISYDRGTGLLQFSTGTTGSLTPRVNLDSSGNLGLGVTPSAWGASFKAVQVGATGALADNGGGDLYLLSNARFDGTNWRYLTTNFANYYAQENGVHQWHNAPSGTAGDPITFTQAMTLDASGRLLLGTSTSGGSKLRISGLPTSSAGLSAGDVWNDGGTLKIV